MSDQPDFETLVNQYYAPLYRFAFTLTRSEAEASDLTQETFHIWAARGHQLRDVSKVKTWLFTTLHREFLRKQRHVVRFPHFELNEETPELPEVPADSFEGLDKPAALNALASLDETFRIPLVLYYLKECSYNEIAEVLGVPLGTVKSRISRGISQLQRLLFATAAPVAK